MSENRIHQHLPKWLIEERFEITYEPGEKQLFRVMLFRRRGMADQQFEGTGRSITRAAKAADKLRSACG